MAVRPAGHKALLAAASAQFAERGFHAVSIREIAAAAGVSLSALYHYYPSKQALLAALLHEGMDDYQARCAEALAEAGHDPARRLAAVVGATVRYRAERSEASLLLMNEAKALEPQERERYRTRQKEASDRFREPIDAGVAAGIFTTPYPDDVRRSIIASCNAVAQWYHPDGPDSLDDLVEHNVYLAYKLLGYERRTPSSRTTNHGAQRRRDPVPSGGTGS